MVVIGVSGTVASGTSTNGAIHKLPGLVSLILQKIFFPTLFPMLNLSLVFKMLTFRSQSGFGVFFLCTCHKS